MLNELKNIEFPGRKNDIIFFLQSVIGDKSIKIDDAKKLCLHVPGKHQLSVDALIEYCRCFGLIKYDFYICLDKSIQPIIEMSEKINDEIIYRTIDKLFVSKIFDSSLFFYDYIKEKFVFKNEQLPLCFASVRNVLISQGFFEVERTQGTVFYINSQYENMIIIHCKKSKNTLTLELLKRRLEDNDKAGELAEKFVLEYERKRLTGSEVCSKVRIVSSIDVSAGYDIVSFDTASSFEYDRFIEVKAVSKNKGFYWSNNEFDVAKIKGCKYHLYLVELCKIDDVTYKPTIIKDPSKKIMCSEEWLVEIEKYYIRHV